MDSDSEDSENESGLGNVTRVVMRPPGHSGKAKRGHLCFDASFETGNLGRVDLINEYEYDLFIRPDTCNPRLRFWFNFAVDNARIDQHVIFNIVNISKKRNCFQLGMTPLIKSTSRNKWQRMPNKFVHYHRSIYHQNNYILSLIFGFDREDDSYQFALTYPYSYSKCQLHLELIEKRKVPHFTRELLGTSVQNRRLDLLTITHPKNMVAAEKLRVIIILGRIHPGESPTSYVCQGIIDFLISNHPIAQTLREHVVFKIIPMMNPDGVFLGNYRSTLMGIDLNRAWHQVSEWIHPTLHATLSFINSLHQDKNLELDFILDLHAHSSLKGVFVYGNTYDDVYRFERHIVFPKLLAQNTDCFAPQNTMFNRDSNKANTARRYLCDVLKDSVNCYSVLVSYYGYNHPVTNEHISFTEESYYRLGRNIVQTYLEYYKVTGVIHVTEQPKTKVKVRKSPLRFGRSSHRKSRTRKKKRHLKPEPRKKETSASDTNATSGDENEASCSSSSEDDGSPSAVPWRPVPRIRPHTCLPPRPPKIEVEEPLRTAELPPLSPPKLSIIDFNNLTRLGVDRANGRGKSRKKRK
nr:PREDICTED: cytosolic carboxypeptidase 6 [Bemisia tabaci]